MIFIEMISSAKRKLLTINNLAPFRIWSANKNTIHRMGYTSCTSWKLFQHQQA